MASSGYATQKITDWDTLRFDWWIVSQDMVANTSEIAWKVSLISGTYGAIDSPSTFKKMVVKIDTDANPPNGALNIEEKVLVGIGNNQTKLLADSTQGGDRYGNVTLTHNADGTRSFSFIVSLDINITFSGKYIGQIYMKSTGVLNTLAKAASQPSCITWPHHTQNVGNFGDTIAIHMNRAASHYTHTVRYAFGSKSGTIATNVGTGLQWTIPLSLMDLIPNTTSGSGTIYVDTYNGSTFLGTKWCGFTATVPASVKPTCTFTLDDTTGIDNTHGSPVQYLSEIRCVVTATPAYSSPIASYSVTIDGITHSGSDVTSEYLTKSGSSEVKVTVTDRRGRSGTASYTMNVKQYTLPNVSTLAVHRCNADGTENERGLYIKATFSAVVHSLSGTATYTLRYKKSVDTAFTSVVLTAVQNQYTVTDYSYVFAADDGSTYDVELQAADKYRNFVRSTSASTGFTLMHFHKEGTGMGIGKVSEKENTLEIALDVEFHGNVSKLTFTDDVRAMFVDIIYPVGSIYLAYNHVSPATLFGGTWVRIENRFLWAVDSKGTIGQTGGASEHTLTVDELPSHNHGASYTGTPAGTKTHAWLASGGSNMLYGSVETGGGKAHNNMPPYIQVSAWRRTA